MITMQSQEVKRRGISALDDSLASGPVYIISHNSPRYVVMFADAFKEMEDALTVARVAASEADIRSGHFSRGSADELIADILEE